ncbi:inositol 1,3,4-triphosphate 5/6 kinase [Histomonas meleagridis]|uniref:inositol 1,3,4-triphosphate 5/6 kinase n=1 Tax=Histomonas meleagridis TaxID=135588 RepID=UPI00355A8658|nr:inositol 1,3,4-triphosphate 5/6 kinase [Histomonas meleagridis]KAH0806803.1 inositol 1,3,4-triphosphate 5/6 kinase [Histomonas meleagridis]
MKQTLKIAVFIPQFKWERMNLASVKPEVHGIELVPADFDTDLSSFDGIIHKFTYQLVDGHKDQVEKIQQYIATRKNFIVIEPIDKINIFINRKELQLLFSKHHLPSYIKYSEGIEDFSSVTQFPVVLKSIEACGTSESHSIRIVHTREQLSEIQNVPPKLMAFPFIPHYGVVFKCYCLGDNYVMRASGSLVLHSKDSTVFDSQKPLPDDLLNTTFSSQNTQEIAPSQEELKGICQSLQEITGVQLLGFDVLRSEVDGLLYLVDVNYFPCFRNIENIGDKLAEFIKKKATNN